MKADPRWLRAYWIDMVKLCEQFTGGDQVVEKVVYFTASPLSTSKTIRQSAFLNANKALNGERFEIVRGKYMGKEIECPYCKAHTSKPEEKRTDVNISVRMIADAVADNADIFSLVSADSDLIPPINYIRANFPNKQVKVYFPPTNFSHDIRDLLLIDRRAPILMKKSFYFFDRAHMEDSIENDGEQFNCPDSWK